MNVLSLFSGIGGLDLGLERAGMTVVGQVEIDSWCRKVLAKHWPEVPRHDDVRTAAEWWLSLADAEGNRLEELSQQDGSADVGRIGSQARMGTFRGSEAGGIGTVAGVASRSGRPAVDLVCGGFPCQPVSLAGKGLAQADSRWLWPAFAGVIRDLRPRYVLVENVPGLLGRGMGDVLGDLAALGYDAEWDSVPAAFVGAPHIRNRVWIVAYPQRGQLRDQPGRRDGQNRPGAPVTGDDGTAQPLADAASHLRRASGDEGPETPDRRGADDADADREPMGWPSEPRCERGHWAAEPDVGRVAHGVPARVDRLRGLGNAVVPQVAEHIGRLIMAAAAEAAA